MTCFLNSLMQNFYFSPLRPRLYEEWSANPESHSNPILKALVTLFAEMEMTNRSSVSTQQLTKAFGWDSSHRSHQSDIHELQTVLFDSLNLPSLITNLYEFDFTDNLNFVCSACSADNKRGNKQTLTEMQLVVKPGCFEGSLKEWEDLETLEGDNGVKCEKCDERNSAKKYQSLSTLPTVLNVCLRRLEFDFTTLTRKRVTSEFVVPLEVTMGTGLGGEENKETYRLSAVMVHSGSANGGHYYSYNRAKLPGGEHYWVKCNDSVTTTLSSSEIEGVLKSVGRNVYMMVFVREGGEIEHAVPEDLGAEVAEREADWEELRKLWEMKQEVLDLKVHFGGNEEAETITVKKTETLEDVVEYFARKRGVKNNGCRLRRFNFGKPGETFQGREELALEKVRKACE